MANGTDERSLINRAVKKLGHPYSCPSNSVALQYLAPYVVGNLSKNAKKRRSQLAKAASIVLTSIMSEKDHPRAEPQTTKKPAKRYKKSAGSEKFYASWEWKKARYEALKLHGRRCQCCGWMPGDTTHGRLVVDHIKPRSKYPVLELDVNNLQVMCNDCNMGKSNIYTDDFRDLDSWLSQIASE